DHKPATGWLDSWAVLVDPIPTFGVLLFVTEFCMLMSSDAINFYTVLDSLRVLLMLLVWMVPTFYPVDIVPEKWRIFIEINALYSYLEVFRGFMYEGTFAPAWNFIYMTGSALLMLLVGVWVFSRSWRQAAVRM